MIFPAALRLEGQARGRCDEDRCKGLEGEKEKCLNESAKERMEKEGEKVERGRPKAEKKGRGQRARRRERKK